MFSLFPALLTATSGSFRGVIVRGPDDNPGWIWVKGANGLLRKVGVNHAHVIYDDAVPQSDRERQPEMSMKSGAEVRVTAESVGASKPDPEGFLKGAAELGVDPADCVVFEDSAAGLTAALMREKTYTTIIQNFLRAHPVTPVVPF